ncbi:hypothetical protein GPECTOR_2g1183 [Gonium pectorale]|uniref:Serpin domain-containing protein n=1 Tax=Gonium pectorale TaxID=33097 RepID=A0A150H0V3_GONPE|nr:hypothetical protein GPECTOR_2g1183 [Gonium pectorale]|eukprot:KXZ55633.1 hypothetical protein GPECTOR_2g1183 [Gonium pectorale]
MAGLASAGYSLFLATLPLVTTPSGYFLSPLSIQYALALAANGAGPNSTTQTELLRVMSVKGAGSPLTEAQVNAALARASALLTSQCPGADGGSAAGSTNRSELILANSIWTAPGTQLRPGYTSQMQELFQATARVAANGAGDVNAWVSSVTHGIIDNLLQGEV